MSLYPPCQRSRKARVRLVTTLREENATAIKEQPSRIGGLKRLVRADIVH